MLGKLYDELISQEFSCCFRAERRIFYFAEHLQRVDVSASACETGGGAGRRFEWSFFGAAGRGGGRRSATVAGVRPDVGGADGEESAAKVGEIGHGFEAL